MRRANSTPRVVRAVAVRMGWRRGQKTSTMEAVRRVLEELSSVLVDEAMAGRRVTIPGIGVFRPYRAKARTVKTIYGPRQTPARVVVKFRAAPNLRREAK